MYVNNQFETKSYKHFLLRLSTFNYHMEKSQKYAYVYYKRI